MGFRDLVNKIKSAFGAQPPGSVAQKCPAPAVKSGLGKEVDALAAKSPTLQNNLRALKNDRWTIEYGKAGGGSYCSRDEKKIVIDSNEKGNAAGIVQTLAHESGHARYTQDPYVDMTGKTKQEYVDANVKRDLKDEGEATMTNCQVRKEIIDNGGDDIGVAGAQADKYEKVYDANSDPAQREQAREQIGNLFADGEHPSTDASKTYRQYYEKPYADHYDAHNPGKTP